MKASRIARTGLLFTAALALTTVGVIANPIVQPTAAHAAISGTVLCANGQAIQGIWIEAADPAKRGWASRSAINGDSSHNTWSHSSLNSGESYQIRVGCGSWTPEYRSTMWSSHSGDFHCLVTRGAAICSNA